MAAMASIGRCPAMAVLARKPELQRGSSLLSPARIARSRSVAAVALCAAKPAAPAVKREPRGITKPRPVSPELQALVGVAEIPRTQALKLIWAYIKENNLQDPQNKKIIICDEKLKKIFAGKDQVGFLEISGLLNPHFKK